MKMTDREFLLTPLLEVIRDSSTYGVARVISVLLGLIALPVFAQIMSPDVLGMYSLVLLTVTISYRLVGQWSRSSILRFDAKYRDTDSYDSYVSTVFLPPLVTGLVVALVFIVIRSVTGALSAFHSYIYVSITVFLLSILDAQLLTFLRVRQKAKQFSLIQVLKRLVALSVGIALIVILDMGGEGLMYGTLVALAIAIPLSLKWTSVTRIISFRRFSKDHLKRYLSYGVPLTIFALSAFLMRHTDRYMILYFKDLEQVGLYSFASMFPQRAVETLIEIIALGAAPIIIREWENTGVEAATATTSGLARYHMLMAVPIVAVMILFPRQILSLIGSTQYAAVYSAIPLLSVGSYFSSLAWFSSLAFSLSTRTTLLLVITLCSLFVNVLLNLLVIPRWGYQGAAFSTMTTSIFYFLGVTIVSRKWLPWGIKIKTIRNVLAIAICSGGLALMLNVTISGRIIGCMTAMIVFVLAYFVGLDLAGEFSLRKAIFRLLRTGAK